MQQETPMNKIFPTFEEALHDLRDGVSVMIAGFGGVGSPANLTRTLQASGVKDVTLISNGAGNPMIEEGRVRKVIASFTAATRPSRRSPVEELQQQGKIIAELTPQGTLAERIRSGGAGIPAFFTPTGVGTEIAKGKEHRTFNGRTYIMEEAITADYAFIRARKADTFGNLVFRRAQRNFNPIMAMAARCTVVEVEEDIVPEGELDPDQIHTPGIFVHRMVRIPEDGLRTVGRAQA
jgi:3-oxoadipate CoA-transferase alpha subunit